jgi:hypothetical protein
VRDARVRVLQGLGGRAVRRALRRQAVRDGPVRAARADVPAHTAATAHHYRPVDVDERDDVEREQHDDNEHHRQHCHDTHTDAE